jgi:xanthine dehydrogenase accessory factor
MGTETDPWSVTTKDLRAALRSFREERRAGAVATVAAVDGAAYRRPGAKMVVPEDGGTYGAVTAGCLEPAVVDMARDAIETGTPCLDVFDLTANENDTWGLGLGCNGVVDLFVEPLDAGWDRPLTVLADEQPVTVATVVASEDTPVGSRAVFETPAECHAVSDRPEIPPATVAAAADVVNDVHGTDTAATVDVNGTTLLIDGCEPVPELLLFGTQHDLPLVARLASEVGFRVTVYSPRGTTDESTVPAADAVVTGHPGDIDDCVVADERTYAVVMSHNLLDDRLAVESLLSETAVPYVGVMGPRKRFEELRDAISSDGHELSEAVRTRVSSPVGLDLGGGEPVEIALSIVSEALAVSNGRGGGRLQDHEGPIHARPSAGPVE